MSRLRALLKLQMQLRSSLLTETLPITQKTYALLWMFILDTTSLRNVLYLAKYTNTFIFPCSEFMGGEGYREKQFNSLSPSKNGGLCDTIVCDTLNQGGVWIRPPPPLVQKPDGNPQKWIPVPAT